MDIKEVLHLYLGCELFTEFDDGSKGKLRLDEYYLTAIRRDWICDTPRPTLCKLILRPLSDMTEEHTHEIADELKIVAPNVFLWMQAALKGGCYFFDTQVKFINALRKRGYDCDGLIDAGLALDKTKL